LFAVYVSGAVLLLFAIGLRSSLVGSLLLTAYVTWSPWHFAGQNYGISLLFLRRRGVAIDATTKRLLYAAFVLSSALAILAVHAADGALVFAQQAVDTSGSYRTLRLGIPTPVVHALGPALAAAYVATWIAAGARLRGRARSGDLVAPASLLATHSLWFVLPSLAATTGAWNATALVFAPIWISSAHAIQYLWITTFYARRSEAPVAAAPFLLKATLAGAAITLLPPLLFAPGLLGSSFSRVAGVGVLIFSAVNLHHFLLDGAVWKLRDGRVARALLREQPADALAVAEPARRWLRPLVWIGGGVALGVIPVTVYERSVATSPTATTARVETALARLAWLGLDTPTNWVELAGRYERAGRAADGIATYRKAFAAMRHIHTLPTPELAAHFAALLLAQDRGDPQRLREALRFASFAVEAAPEDPTALEVLAEANARAGDLDRAREVGGLALARARATGETARAASIERRLRSWSATADPAPASP
jgi:hypothetical protein